MVFQQIFPLFLWLSTPLSLSISVIALLFSVSWMLLSLCLKTTMTKSWLQMSFSKCKFWKCHLNFYYFHSFFNWPNVVFDCDLYWVDFKRINDRWKRCILSFGDIWISNWLNLSRTEFWILTFYPTIMICYCIFFHFFKKRIQFLETVSKM